MASGVQYLGLIPGTDLIIRTITIMSYMMGTGAMGHFIYEPELLWASLNPLWANTYIIQKSDDKGKGYGFG